MRYGCIRSSISEYQIQGNLKIDLPSLARYISAMHNRIEQGSSRVPCNKGPLHPIYRLHAAVRWLGEACYERLLYPRFYAAALLLLRSMTIPSHMNHTI